MGLIINVDGGSRGNPGPAGAGVVIRDDRDQLVHEGGYWLGRQTNNAAEYRALIIALQRVARMDDQPLSIHSDSELLVRQVTGEYRVKSPKLEQLYRQVQVLLLKVSRWKFQHVRREQNSRADKLANMAMDQQGDVIVFDIETAKGEQPRAAIDDRSGVAAAEPAPPAKAITPAPPALGASTDRAVRVVVSHNPDPDICPVRGSPPSPIHMHATTPAGLCVYAAHAILPTLLAMRNTEPQEFAAIPTMTVRCTRPGCGAAFALSPLQSTNGPPKK